MRTLVGLAAVAAMVGGVSVGAQNAEAVTLGFSEITANSPIDLSGQLSVDVTDEGSGQVRFTFNNALGGLASSIAEIYFDDGTLLGIAQVVNPTGVSFSQGASPPDLPGGNALTPDFQTTAGFLADAGNQAPTDGVNPGEWVAIIFDLINGQTFADTIAALALGGADGGLRIGLHVIALSDGGSESYVNGPINPVPLPAGLVLFLSGLAGVGFLGRFKAKRSEPATA